MLYSISDSLLPGRGYMRSAVDQEDPLSGALEESPMELDITVLEMDNVMSVLHARQLSSPLKLAIEQWSEALHIATIWRLTAAREYTIERITSLFPNQPPVDRIALADLCGVQQWFNPAYETICTRADAPTMNEGVQRLGFDRIIALFTIREACRKIPPAPVVSANQSAWCNSCRATRTFYSSSSTHVHCLYCGHTIPISSPTATVVASAEIASKLVKDSKELSWKTAEEEAKAETPSAPEILSDALRNVINKLSPQSKYSAAKGGMKGKKGCKGLGKPGKQKQAPQGFSSGEETISEPSPSQG
ncbi:hypothetical protein FRB95_006569 [Tulasnella sp. JGI-2019a]|nr:hypothetical protein FRB95_006569 [Tulasnella sp. JGI-2019a]